MQAPEDNIDAVLAGEAPEATEAAAPAPAPAAAGSAEEGADATGSAGDAAALDAVARARAIAASLGLAGSAPLTGKRKADGEPTAGGAVDEASGDNKLRRKVYVPVEKAPGANWLGLLLGPKGVTLQAMEAESGARLLVRGRGVAASVGNPAEEQEELHVVIIADSQEQVRQLVV